MEAPKCKFCGKVEWRHVCGGVPRVVEKAAVEREPVRVGHNEYMRVYMKGWRRRRSLLVDTARAVEEGRACFVKKG